MELLLPLAFLAVLWVLLIRPQQKQRKAQDAARRSLAVGDDVVTIGGLHGRVVDLPRDDAMDLLVCPGEEEADDVVLRYERAALGRIVHRAADDADADTPGGDDDAAEDTPASDEDDT
ncbi:MAG: preprotein translocase subunit YajC [Nitriliruptoraceae bacterium]